MLKTKTVFGAGEEVSKKIFLRDLDCTFHRGKGENKTTNTHKRDLCVPQRVPRKEHLASISIPCPAFRLDQP